MRIEGATKTHQIIVSYGTGEQPIVTNAMKAPGQYVNQETPDEFIRTLGHRLVSYAAFTAIVLELKGHFRVGV